LMPRTIMSANAWCLLLTLMPIIGIPVVNHPHKSSLMMT